MTSKEDDEFVIIMHIGLAFGVIVAAVSAIAVTAWTATLKWLLEHNIVVPAGDRPWVHLPRADGAGLDGPRIAVAAAIIVVLVAAAAQSVHRWWAKGRELQ